MPLYFALQIREFVINLYKIMLFPIKIVLFLREIAFFNYKCGLQIPEFVKQTCRALHHNDFVFTWAYKKVTLFWRNILPVFLFTGRCVHFPLKISISRCIKCLWMWFSQRPLIQPQPFGTFCSLNFSNLGKEHTLQLDGW